MSINKDMNSVIDPQQHFYRSLQLKIVKFVNLVGVTAIFALTWLFSYADVITAPLNNYGNHLVIFLFSLIYFFYGRTYDAFVVSLSSIGDKVYSQALACFFTNTIMYIVFVILASSLIHIGPLILCLVLQILFAFGWSKFTEYWYFKKFPAQKTLLLGDELADFRALLHKHGLKRNFIVQKTMNLQTFLLNDLSQLRNFDCVFLIDIHSHERNQILKYCVTHDIKVYIVPRIGDLIMCSATPVHILHLPLLYLGRYNPRPEYLLLKRIFDLILAGIVFILLIPSFVLIAIAIKIEDRGPIFYKQVRLTKDGQLFKVLKFRSMQVDAEQAGKALLSTGSNDKRVTKVGAILRKFRLDELPQLLNIIRGEMSIVGPRPERPEIATEYAKNLPEFVLRLQTKAGLTGYAQVYGKYNTTPYAKLEMDLIYLANSSLLEDLKIIFATVKILFKSDSTEGFEADE